MSFYGDDGPTDATESRRKFLQQWREKLNAYQYNDRIDLRATDGTCAPGTFCAPARLSNDAAIISNTSATRAMMTREALIGRRRFEPFFVDLPYGRAKAKARSEARD
jgi:hypothetical protein